MTTPVNSKTLDIAYIKTGIYNRIDLTGNVDSLDFAYFKTGIFPAGAYYTSSATSYTKTFSVDGYIKITTTRDFTADAIIELGISTVDKDFTIDAIIKETKEASLSLDGLVKEKFSTQISTDSIIKEVLTKEFTTDSIIKEILTKSRVKFVYHRSQFDTAILSERLS